MGQFQRRGVTGLAVPGQVGHRFPGGSPALFSAQVKAATGHSWY